MLVLRLAVISLLNHSVICRTSYSDVEIMCVPFVNVEDIVVVMLCCYRSCSLKDYELFVCA